MSDNQAKQSLQLPNVHSELQSNSTQVTAKQSAFDKLKLRFGKPQTAKPKSLADTNYSDFRKNTERYVIYFAVGIVFILFINGMILYFANATIKELKLLKQQIVTTQNQSQELSNSLSYLEEKEEAFNVIKQALPDESGLVNFIEMLEFIARENASNSSIKFSALAPTGTGENKYIPFTISMTTDRANFRNFLSRLEKLPYIVEVQSIETSGQSGNESVWDINIAARVYVKNPFKEESTLKIAI